jgi:hypothetical protein
MSKVSLPLVVGLGRAGYGLAAYAAPQTVAARSGFPGAAQNADGAYVTRLFGARDVVIGLLTLVPGTRRAALPIGVLVDVLDTGSGVLAGQEGMSRRTSAIATGVAGGFAALGVVAMLQNRRGS